MFSYDKDKQAEQAETHLLPDGDYDFVIVRVEMKRSKAGNNNLVIVFTGTNEASGSTLTEYLCVDHPSDGARQIAIRKLGYICNSINVSQFDETTLTKLLRKHITLSVGQSTYQNMVGDTLPKNVIKAFKPPREGRGADKAELTDAWARVDANDIDDDIPF